MRGSLEYYFQIIHIDLLFRLTFPQATSWTFCLTYWRKSWYDSSSPDQILANWLKSIEAIDTIEILMLNSLLRKATLVSSVPIHREGAVFRICVGISKHLAIKKVACGNQRSRTGNIIQCLLPTLFRNKRCNHVVVWLELILSTSLFEIAAQYIARHNTSFFLLLNVR